MAKQFQYSENDEILLFTEFPFDHKTSLPLHPCNGVILAEPPYTALQTPDDDHMPCYVLPGVKLPGFGMCHTCLVSPSDSLISEGETRRGLMFSYLSALRMIAPAGIGVGGHFTYGDHNIRIKDASLLSLHSRWQPKSHLFSDSEVMQAGIVLGRMNNYSTTGPRRLRNAIVLFTQVTNGYCLSYQMSVMGMYSALESLFVPSSGKASYARTLGQRVASYLGSFSGSISLSDWIEQHYQEQRHSIAHGYWEMSPNEDVANKKLRDFGILHEALRLSLLGFLSLSRNDLNFLDKSGATLKRGLDSLAPATGDLLINQSMWL